MVSLNVKWKKDQKFFRIHPQIPVKTHKVCRISFLMPIDLGATIRGHVEGSDINLWPKNQP